MLFFFFQLKGETIMKSFDELLNAQIEAKKPKLDPALEPFKDIFKWLEENPFDLIYTYHRLMIDFGTRPPLDLDFTPFMQLPDIQFMPTSFGGIEYQFEPAILIGKTSYLQADLLEKWLRKHAHHIGNTGADGNHLQWEQ